MEKEISELKCKEFNDRVGSLKNYDCHICKNKGWIMYSRYEDIYDDFIEIIKECECMAKRREIQKMIKSGLGDYLNKTFDDYKIENDWQYRIMDKAVNYLKERDKWFIICGQSGCGKTLICSIIANKLLEKENVVYITWTDFISRLKRDMMSDNANEVSQYLYSIKSVPVLYIDELLKKYNDTDLKYIIEIINYRYTNNLKTIITSEHTIDELIDIDEATFGRVIEKCGSYVTNVKKDKAKNWRLKGVL